jgi:TRAP-type C4-dicarboxylate transport system substrate-binding protein
MTPVSTVHTFIAMNKGFFEKLTPAQQKIILEASAAIEGNTVSFGRNTLKGDMEEARKKARVYIPTPAEAALWHEGMVPLWEEIARDKPEVAEALKNVRGQLKR